MRIRPIRTDADHRDALAEIERLWGAPSGTPEGDTLDVLAALAETCEERRWPLDATPANIGLVSGLRHKRQIVPDTWVTLFAFGREVLMPWKECSVMDDRLRFVGRLLDGEALCVDDPAVKRRFARLSLAVAEKGRRD